VKIVITFLLFSNKVCGKKVVNLRTIRPLDVAAVVASVNKTKRCVTVEEGWAQHGVGAEIIALLNERKIFDITSSLPNLTHILLLFKMPLEFWMPLLKEFAELKSQCPTLLN
jgi:pyruvate/2-oxoglutarate/acetoin dehydrogenase E1 component